MCLTVRDEHIRHILAAAAAVFALWPLAASGQSCGLLAVIEAGIEKEYGELPMAEWRAAVPEGAPQMRIRLYVNTKTGTVTLLSVPDRRGHAMGCLAASGDQFRPIQKSTGQEVERP